MPDTRTRPTPATAGFVRSLVWLLVRSGLLLVAGACCLLWAVRFDAVVWWLRVIIVLPITLLITLEVARHIARLERKAARRWSIEAINRKIGLFVHLYALRSVLHAFRFRLWGHETTEEKSNADQRRGNDPQSFPEW